MSFAFTPPDGYRNTTSFPTTPASETAFRDSMQSLLDQITDELNSGSASSIGIQNALRQAASNGGFAVNQRVKSGTVVLAAGAYGHDRWKAGAAGCTYTFATSDNVTTITISAGSLIQVIEGINLYSGTYTLSWTGTSQGKIGAGSYGTSGITGTATGGTNLNIEFNTGTLSKVQLNYGDLALPFQPRSFAEELALCLRYYEKSYSYAVAPGTAGALTGQANWMEVSASNFHRLHQRFSVPKRLAPTVTIYSPNTGVAGKINQVGTGDVNAFADYVNDKSFVGAVNNVSTSGELQFHWAADSEL